MVTSELEVLNARLPQPGPDEEIYLGNLRILNETEVISVTGPELPELQSAIELWQSDSQKYEDGVRATIDVFGIGPHDPDTYFDIYEDGNIKRTYGAQVTTSLPEQNIMEIIATDEQNRANYEQMIKATGMDVISDHTARNLASILSYYNALLSQGLAQPHDPSNS